MVTVRVWITIALLFLMGSISRFSLILRVILFEYTTKLKVNYLNQFSDKFHIKTSNDTIKPFIVSWDK